MDDPAEVARTGLEALMRGDAEVIHGEHNREAVAQVRTKLAAENAEALADLLRPQATH